MFELFNLDPKKPWLRADGSKLTDNEIKLVSKFWTADQWEAYLQTIEFEEDPNVIRSASDKIIESAPKGELKDLLPDSSNLSDQVIDLVRLAMNSEFVKEREREVMHLVYWEGKSDSEIAEIMNLGISLVKKIKIKSRLKIKRILEAYAAYALRENRANRGIQNSYKSKGDV